jgi:hypothetical protein
MVAVARHCGTRQREEPRGGEAEERSERSSAVHVASLRGTVFTAATPAVRPRDGQSSDESEPDAAEPSGEDPLPADALPSESSPTGPDGVYSGA